MAKRSAVQVIMELEKWHAVTDISRYENVFTVREGFFWEAGNGEELLKHSIECAFPDATIIETGTVRKAFKGGAPISRQSHYYVKFTFPE